MSALRSAKELLARAANCDPAAVHDDAQLGQMEGWDSLAHLRLILAIEEKLGRMLDPEETVAIARLADIAALVAAEKTSP